MAGKKRLKNFMRRHPQLAFRTPHLNSLSRVKSYTKKNVDAFSDMIKQEFKSKETGHQIVFGRKSFLHDM
jgi:hypothetical protein